jgi:UDP-N-acetylglucosamine acyltransferase
MGRIHPTALIEPTAELAADVEVGPYTIIGAQVKIGAGSVVGPHVIVTGRTSLGARNRIFPFASIGDIPQDQKYAGEPTTTTIGNDNVFREYVTVHAGTAQDRGDTAIGHGNLFLAYTHVAHDCVVGNRTIFSNNAQIAGHVRIDDWVVLGAYSGVHQFCRIGAHVMVGAGSKVFQDVPPFVMASGGPAKPFGTNSEGLRRRGFPADDLLVIRRAYRTLYREGRSLEDARSVLSEAAKASPVLAPLVAFLAEPGRGIIR